ncbi:signal transduction histidine kinase [Kitasatospora sp. MAA4]|uniref:sensor histidine kinase n=1 Tax=Kitasatospora sp. MAA4 TaxID=3035093 RepID=UPI0024756075|nr:HAMP domain-containing sensor histidine kinase [Kitasatospora sp. MAA4]MDH6137703.1 signal transduction histidine kinase [Kitasatospora sp. MAA4]
MRALLAGVVLAVTSTAVLAFLIPLALLTQTQLRGQAIARAEQRAAALAPVLAVSGPSAEPDAPDDPEHTTIAVAERAKACVHLPDGSVVGLSHAPAARLRGAVRGGEAVGYDVPGGWDYLQPVVLADARVAVVEEFVPAAELSKGLTAAWTELAALGTALVLGSVLVADRLGARIGRALRRVSAASDALGAGDLDIRVDPAGPRELRATGLAFNAMADRISTLLATERELIADMSHRLRTPLTALYLASEQVGPVPGAERVSAAIHQMESELDSVIRAARAPLPANRPGGDGGSAARTAPAARTAGRRAGAGCEVAEVARHRVGFWEVLATQQQRSCTFAATDEPTPVALPEDDLAVVVDALVGNVFRHTGRGVPFEVSVQRTAQSVVLVVEDGGAGIADPDSVLARGVSVGGSTGLGLDIARRTAASTRGSLRVTPSALGGARVEVELGLVVGPRRPLHAAWTEQRRRRRARR